MARDKPTVSVKLDTRNEIIYYADCLIRQLGYNAFSYADIGKMMDVRPAAIHYYFQVKGDLGREVIQQELFRIGEFRRWNRKLSGGDQLKRLFNSFYNNSRSNEICLMGSLTPDFATFDPSMQKSVTELCDAVGDWVTYCLEDEREKDRMRFEGTAGDRALLVVSVLLSSLLLGRARGEEVFVRMADRLLADLGADWRIADLPPALQGAGASPWSFT
jgi:TetR/AcrR family transcriptional regulator, transcriptional repressor for nem operon